MDLNKAFGKEMFGCVKEAMSRYKEVEEVLKKVVEKVPALRVPNGGAWVLSEAEYSRLLKIEYESKKAKLEGGMIDYIEIEKALIDLENERVDISALEVMTKTGLKAEWIERSNPLGGDYVEFEKVEKILTKFINKYKYGV